MDPHQYGQLIFEEGANDSLFNNFVGTTGCPMPEKEESTTGGEEEL